MKNIQTFLALIAFSISGFTHPSIACSSFQLNGKSHLVGKSYDWKQTHGQLLTNARNLKKTSLLIPSIYPTETWTSKYGSLTFHQHGKEFPLGGMNEKGLVVEILWLTWTEYPDADNRPALNELQWIQYQLDNFATVKDVLADVDKRRISALFADVHYMVCDTTECAVVEFIGKTESPTSGKSMIANVITNSTYPSSAQHLKKFAGFGGTQPVPTSDSSLDRFARLAMQLDVPMGTTDTDHAFDLLASVEQKGFTQWNIVYDPIEQNISFRTPGGDIKSVEVSAFDFSCKAKKHGQWLDFLTTEKNDVTSFFADYDSAVNKKLVEDGSAVLKNAVPDVFMKDAIKAFTDYPATVACTEK